MDDAPAPTVALARFASRLQLADIPAATVAHVQRSILDTIGCGLQGAGLEWSRITQQVARDEGASPAATAWGTDIVTSRALAAWLNGTACHGFEFDDVHMGGMIHPGALTLSAALAIGEPARIDGATLLAAVVAGCEVGARVGRAVGTAHFLAGFHPQGTVGVFAAAAAAARAARASEDVMHHALGIAGCHASGLMAAQRGAMVKRLHSGHAAQSGVQATLLAARGFTGIDDVLEADFGGFCSTMGGGSVQLGLLAAGLGSHWATDEIAFKPYPSCAAAQASIEATRLLREAHDLQPADVERVLVTTSHHVLTHSGWHYVPEGITAAQMSIAYGVGRMLLDGSLEARHFGEADVADREVLALTDRVEVVSDPALDALGPDRRYVARVDITTTDGRVLHRDIDDRPGNTSNPLTSEQLGRKFRSLAGPAVGAEATARIEALVADLDSLPDVAALAGELRVPAEVRA